MNVYVVTSGDYSAYQIDAVFTSEEAAWKYASLDDDRRIEEYETDTITIDDHAERYIVIEYDFERNTIFRQYIATEKVIVPGIMESRRPCLFLFSIENTMKNYKAFLKLREGKINQYMLKIAQDEFAVFMVKHGYSRQELIERSYADSKRLIDEFNARYGRGFFLSTSL